MGSIPTFSLRYCFLKWSRERPNEKARDYGDLPPKAVPKSYLVGGGDAIVAGLIKLSNLLP